MILTKTGWTYYEEVEGLEKNSVAIIGRIIAVDRDKRMENLSKKSIGLVLLNKKALVKFAVTNDVAVSLCKEHILADARVMEDKVYARYEAFKKFPQYTNINDLITLWDFPDGQKSVCIEETNTGFVVVTAGRSEIEHLNGGMISERISYLGEELGLPANIGISNMQYKLKKSIKG